MGNATRDGNATSPEHLHERETAILKRLAAGLSDQQIADDLVLSLHTVKWYNRQIYSKLQVKSHTEAIARASALGLFASESAVLPPPAPPRMASQRVFFTNSFDGTRIAYANGEASSRDR